MSLPPIGVIAFKYPPYAGVGGFRWTKITKYLARKGHEIHVITVNWPAQEQNSFVADTDHSNINIKRIASNAPHVWGHRKYENWLVRKVFNFVMYRVLTKYIYWDDFAQYWRQPLHQAMEELTREHSVNTFVATGSPFEAIYWATQFQSDHNVNVIADFRDPWIDPIRTYSESQHQTLQKRQAQSLQLAAATVAVTKPLLDQLAVPKGRGVVITNGFDHESIISTANAPAPAPAPGTICHIGNTLEGREKPLTALLTAIEKSPLHDKIRLTLVGRINPNIRSRFQQLETNGILTILPSTSQAEAFRILCTHRYALQLNADLYPELVSTKIYEYAALRRPIVSVNYGGEIDRLVREEFIGESLCANDQEQLLNFLERSLQNETPVPAPVESVQRYRYDAIADQYSQLIESLG